MNRVALRGIRAHLVRFLLSVLAVTLGVAFVAGTFSLRTMMSSTFSGIIETSMVGDAYVHGTEDAASVGEMGTEIGYARNPIPVSLVGTIEDVEGVGFALPSTSGPIVLVGADGTAVTSAQSPSFGMALYPEDDGADIVAGAAPGGPNEIGLESATLESSELVVGDTTKVVLGGEIRPVTVVAEVSMGAPMAGASIVLLDPETAAASYAADGMVPTIAVYGESGVTEDELVDRIDLALASTAEDSVEAVRGEDMRAEANEDIDGMLGFIQTFMLVFAGISLFVGAFIISNTFAMSVQQRMREFALLRAIGASPAQVFASILIQAAVVGLVGSVLGIGAGVGLVSLVRVVFERFGMGLSGNIPLDATTVLVSVAVGVIVSIVAAALPARRAALTAPVEAMRGDTVAAAKSLRGRSIAGSALVVLGVAGLGAASLWPEDNGALLLGVGAGGVILGVLALSPTIARSTVGVLTAGFVVAVKPLGRLARGNITRNPRRTANTAGALMIGMALVGAAAVLAASATASTQSIVDGGWIADFSLQSATEAVPGGLIAEVDMLDTVDSVDVLTYGPATVEGTPGVSAADETMLVVGLPVRSFGTTLELNVVEGTLGSFADGEIAVQKAVAEEHEWGLGEDVTFATATGSVSAPVGAIIDDVVIGSPIIVPEQLFADVVPATQSVIDALLVTSNATATPAEVRADLVSVAAPYVVISVMDKADFASKLAGQVDQILGILYAMLALSVIIAILGIVNTLALSVIERTREIGLMRAVGLGRLQLAGIITIESIMTALFGTIIGMVVGVGIAALMPAVFSDIGLTVLAIPWLQLGWMLVLAAVIGVVAALWPAIHAARLPVLDAVAAD